jgi:hypothetical protein
MPRSDWRQFCNDHGGIILVAFVAVAFCLGVIEIASLRQGHLYNDASRQANYYAERANDEIAVKCARLAGQPKRDCEQPIEDVARQNQRDEHDLYSQQAVALWTSIMGVMAVIGVAVSGAGLWAIIKTIRQGHESNRIATDALRPYIVHETDFKQISDPASSELLWIMCDIKIQNIGQSPSLLWIFVEIINYNEKDKIITSHIESIENGKERTLNLSPNGSFDFKNSIFHFQCARKKHYLVGVFSYYGSSNKSYLFKTISYYSLSIDESDQEFTEFGYPTHGRITQHRQTQDIIT